MKIFNIVAIFIYSIIFSIIGAILVGLSLRTESIGLIINLMTYLSQTNNLRFGMALVGILFILINISIARLSIGKLQKHRTIAFENPHGQVTVALSAIEDYVKKITQKMTEIKEIKSHIYAGRHGLEIVAKAVLYSNINIPEVTEKIQNTIRLRLHEILGIEDTVKISIHVTKIAQKAKEVETKDSSQTEQSGFKGEIEYGGDVS